MNWGIRIMSPRAPAKNIACGVHPWNGQKIGDWIELRATMVWRGLQCAGAIRSCPPQFRDGWPQLSSRFVPRANELGNFMSP